MIRWNARLQRENKTESHIVELVTYLKRNKSQHICKMVYGSKVIQRHYFNITIINEHDFHLDKNRKYN